MPYCEGPRSQPMQPSQPLAMVDRILSQSHRFQLRPPYHPVLALCQPCHRNLQIASLRKPAYIAGFRRLGGHGLRLTRNLALVVRGLCQVSRGSVP